MSPDTPRPRPSWKEYFLQLAETVARRSEDPWVQVGAVVVRRDNSIAGCGYNGAPAGCEIDWTDRDARRQFVVHAEVNALSHARPGEAALLASTLLPCPNCLTLIASYGIREVVYREDYLRTSESSLEVAKTFGVTLQQLPARQ